MASGEPPPMHDRSFVQTVFDYSLWPHIGWSGLDNLLYRNGLAGRITRQPCTSPRHFWMPSKGRKQTQQLLSSVFLPEHGEALAQALPRRKLSLPGHREVLCCSVLGSMEKSAPAALLFHPAVGFGGWMKLEQSFKFHHVFGAGWRTT